MAATIVPQATEIPGIPTVTLRELAPWAIFGGLLFVLMLFFVGVDQGALSIVGGRYVHEFVHDARHILAFPCH